MNKEKICTQCGYIGKEVSHTKGSFIMEVILWICFIFPGLLYSVWRLSTKEKVCPECKLNGMIPVNSKKGKILFDHRPL